MAFLKFASQVAPALATATSANGTARNGSALLTNGIRANALSLKCTCTIVTGSVVATFKAQGTTDGTNWSDLYTAAGVAVSMQLSASGTQFMDVPQGACGGIDNLRAVATLSGASTASGDTTTVGYCYRIYDGNP